MHSGFLSTFSRAAVGLAVAALLVPAAALAGEVRFDGQPGHAENPAWSTDGKHLAFEVNRFAGDIEMYVSEVSGDIAKDARSVKLPGGGSGFGGSGQVVMNATWHKDGIVVFEGSNQGGQLRLYFTSPGGSVASEMFASSKVPGGLSFPAISPDGEKLAFVSDSSGNGDVQEWNRSTDEFTPITSSPGSESFPSYTRDGSKLLFTRKVDDSLSVFAHGDGGEKKLAQGQGDQTRPVHAEGDTVVYFSAREGGKWDLMAVGIDGSDARTLAEGVRFPIRARPALSPDGKWVAFAYDDPTRSSKIVLKRVDGSQTVEIPTEFVACGEPAFGGQGTSTLLAFTALKSADSDWRRLHVIDISDKL